MKKNKVTSVLMFILVFVNFVFTGIAKTSDRPVKQGRYEDRLIILDPVHPHVVQLQQSLKQWVNQQVYVYAPNELFVRDNYINLLEKSNRNNPENDSWKITTYIGEDFLKRMIKEKKGTTVIIASNNYKKPEYILAAAQSGFNIIVDKPMVLTPGDFKVLCSSFELAESNKCFITDLPAMSMRKRISYIIQKEILSIPELFGRQERGTVNEPAIVQENVHHYLKKAVRPAFFFDIGQQGSGISDVTTHLIDLVQWSAFSGIDLDYSKDIQVLGATVWPTVLNPAQFQKVTRLDKYPDYLRKYVKDTLLNVYSNGKINYTIKGVHAKVISKWNYQAQPGAGDTYQSVFKGTKAKLFIEAGQPNDLFIYPNTGVDHKDFEKNLKKHFERLKKEFSHIELVKEHDGWKIHTLVGALKYSNNLIAPSKREVDNMLAKYYITTQAFSKMRFVND